MTNYLSEYDKKVTPYMNMQNNNDLSPLRS